MLCVVIKGPSYDEAHRQISKVLPYADVVELRLELFTFDFKQLKNLRSEFSIPMIFTLRSVEQGGSYTKSESERQQELKQLATLNPEYLDVEFHVPEEVSAAITQGNPDVKLIISHHDFNETPENLDALYEKMQKIPAWGYKLAVMAQNATDTMRLLCWAKKIKGNKIIIAMGTHGQVSRILSPLMQNAMTYACIDDDIFLTPGQLPATVLLERFHFRSLNSETVIYGLLGNPVERSIGDLVHNRFFEAKEINAVYVKIQLESTELKPFLKWAAELPFQGFSVTTPFKEEILSLIDDPTEEVREIGAVNTLYKQNGRWIACNTDGVGALNAIEEQFPVEGKRAVLIGAGGTAKAIAFEAHKRGASITVLNRNFSKAESLASRVAGQAKHLNEMSACAEEGYDLLINCTPVDMPIDASTILPGTIVMEVKMQPKDSYFFQAAEKSGCHLIYGYQMFLEQAIGQYVCWFPGRFSTQECRSFLNSNEWTS